jgi:hypothetical protein
MARLSRSSQVVPMPARSSGRVLTAMPCSVREQKDATAVTGSGWHPTSVASGNIVRRASRFSRYGHDLSAVGFADVPAVAWRGLVIATTLTVRESTAPPKEE